MFSLQPVCCTPWGARIRVLSFGSYLLVCLWARNTLDLHLLRKLKVITHQGLLSIFHTSLYSRILIGKHWFLLYYWNHWSKLAIRKASMLTLSPRQQHLLSWFILPDEHYHCSMKTKQMQPYIYIRALSPFKTTLLNLCWPAFCIIVQQMDRAENKKKPFPAHVHLYKKLSYQDKGGKSDQPLQTKGWRLSTMAP